MDIKQLTEAFIELSESNEVELSKLQATDTPSVFDIIEDGKKVGFLEFPELEYETQEAIEEQELSYYRHGEDVSDDPEVEDLSIIKVEVKEYDEVNDTYNLEVSYKAYVNGEEQESTIEVVYATPRIGGIDAD